MTLAARYVTLHPLILLLLLLFLLFAVLLESLNFAACVVAAAMLQYIDAACYN